MEQVIFSCLTPGGECEWFHLKDFVDAFNAINGTSYYRSMCIDAYGPENKQPARAPKRPEVMIEAEGEAPIVIERKAVVWPPKFQRDHSKEHYLPSRVIELLGEEFRDSVYELKIHSEDLRGKNLRQVDEFGSQIAHLISSHSDRAKSSRGIGGRNPIRWGIRPLSPHEFDRPNWKSGFKVTIDVPSVWDLEPIEIREHRKATLAGFAKRFVREASRAGEKYGEYADCQRLLVVQFFGESELINSEEIVDTVKAARIPMQIDQVWLTGREWVSDDDYELAWERVR